MKKSYFFFTTALMALFFFSGLAQNKPPLTPSQPVTETYFGKEITDPYRNLENLKDTAVQLWTDGKIPLEIKWLSDSWIKIPVYK